MKEDRKGLALPCLALPRLVGKKCIIGTVMLTFFFGNSRLISSFCLGLNLVVGEIEGAPPRWYVSPPRSLPFFSGNGSPDTVKCGPRARVPYCATLCCADASDRVINCTSISS